MSETTTNVKQPIYCSLAFGSVSINSYGEYIPCCNIRMEHFKLYKDIKINYPLSTDPATRINMDNLKTIRKDLANGIWPLACQNCKNAEDNNIASMRTIWNKEIPDAPINEVINPLDVTYLDLTFSTKCNSKCMTCNADLSDFWEEEYAVHFPNSRNRNINRVSINVSTAHKLIDTFPNVRRISFIGGEPTISDEHIEFLKMLITKGTSNNIGLSYVTNLTGITEELLDLWGKFYRVHLAVSIDGFGKINEYIRYPFKWSKTENSLQTILKLCQYKPQNYSMSLSCTHSVYNAIQAPDLFEYFYDTLKTYDDTTNNDTLLHMCGAFVNRVSYPKDAMICNLSTAYREKGIKKVNNLLKKIQTDIDNGLKVNQGIIGSIKLLGVWLEEPCSMDNDNITTLINFINTSDKFRNRNINDYIPELMEELQYLKENTKD
jgi:hypothetical protein